MLPPSERSTYQTHIPWRSNGVLPRTGRFFHLAGARRFGRAAGSRQSGGVRSTIERQEHEPIAIKCLDLTSARHRVRMALQSDSNTLAAGPLRAADAERSDRSKIHAPISAPYVLGR